MKIELKTMSLQNFKKERRKDLSFAHGTIISGGNETGKSTIYDAYLWCLFGTTSRPDSTVQTLDKNNEVIHKIETVVTIVLNYNDERDIKIERRLSERWKGKDTVEEKFMGTTQARLIDDVPYSVAAFKEKLNNLCNFDDWFMLSNINLFWTYKVDVRRKILMSLAGDIDEESLMIEYPEVYKGVVKERKNLADMLVQQKVTRKKANDELQEIPARVQAQDVLRIAEDFAALEADLKATDEQIGIVDNALQGVVTDTKAQTEYADHIAKAQTEYNNVRDAWNKQHYAQVDDIFAKISAASEEQRKALRQQKENRDANAQNRIKLSTLTDEFNALIQQWKDANEKEFNFDKTDVCPVCGRPYTDEMKEKEYENAVCEFNAHKADVLAKIQKTATEKRGQITVLKGIVNTYEEVTAAKDNQLVLETQSEYEALCKARAEIQSESWEESEEKKAADVKLNDVKSRKPVMIVDATLNDNKQKKADLTKRHDEIIKRLSGRDTNIRIEQEKQRLDNRSRELAQIIADCNEVIRQIKEYKKAKIAVVENKVNSFFSLIRWKFYEQNITNDDEKEVCTAIDKNGVDYNNTNDGTVINMGIDIINGVSKAKDIYVPLFVDRKESVENALPSHQQAIYLQCKYGEPFKVETI